MKTKALIILFLLIFILSIPTICASDNQSAIEDNIILNSDSNNILSDDDLSFSDLDTSISNTPEGEVLTLTNNYTYSSDNQYVNGIVINKAIVIDGAGHTIDGDNSARIFTISASNVVLKNIIFKNANSTNDKGGGALFIANGAFNVTVDNSTFINNYHSKNGGAILWQGDNGFLTSSKFIANNANKGGAVYWINDYGLITNTVFDSNSANGDGGALFWNPLWGDDSNSRILNSTFTNNKAMQSAGAIYLGVNNALINKSTFINNTASKNGGASYILQSASNCQVVSSLFINNTADDGANTISWRATGKITDSILILPQSGYIIQTSGDGDDLIADYNWWGNTNSDFQINDRISGVEINNWLFLNITKDGDATINDSIDLNVKINNLYDGNLICEYANNSLPTISMSLNALNGTLSNDSVVLSKGSGNINFIPTEKSCVVSAYYYNISSIIKIATKLKILFNVSISNVTYSQNATASVKANVDGEYILNINNKNYTVNVLNGVALIYTDILPAGDYIATLIFNGNESYASAQNKTLFSVMPANNTLNVTINDTEYLKNATALITASVDGKYTLQVNNKIYNVNVFEGVAEVILDILPVKEYEAILKFLNTNYTNLENTTRFNVTKISNTLNITIKDTFYPNNATVKVMASADGRYFIKVNEKTYTADVENGEATIYLDVLPVSVYDAFLDFDSDNYLNTFNSTKFSVLKGTNTLRVEVNNIDYPLNATAYVSASVDGEYKITINNVDYNVNVKNNTGNVTLNVLYVGKYDVNLTFSDANYTNLNNQSSFEVNKGKNTLKVIIDDVTIADNPVAYVIASVDGKYSLNVVGKIYNLTVSGGIANVSIDKLSINQYSAILTFSDNNYTNLQNQTIFNVGKLNNELKVIINDTQYLKEIIAQVSASVDGKYTLEVNGKIYNVTVKDGKDNVSLNSLYVGKYSAILKFINENCSNTENSTSFNITQASNSLNITVNDVIYPLNATAIVKASVDGKYIVNVNDENYTVIVNGGVGSTTLNVLTVKLYTAKVIFDNKNFTNLENETTFNVTGSSNTLSVEINNAQYNINATAFVRASVDGEYLLEVNGSTYTINVLNGIANVTIKALQRGTYNANLIFDNENYANHKNTTTFDVLKADYEVSIKVDNVYYPGVAFVNVFASVDGEYLLKVNNNEYRVNVSNGVGVKKLDLLQINTYSITVSNTDLENYNEFTNKTTFKVLAGNNTLSINIPNVDFITPATAYVEASIDGNYTIEVNSKIYDVVVKNNKGNVTFERFALGVYEAILKFGNENYTNLQNSTTFKIAQYFNRLSMEIDNVVYPGNVTIFITVNINGAYNLTVGGKTYPINIDKTTGNITISNLASGNYTAVLTLIDSEYFTSPTNTTDFTVYKYPNKLEVSFTNTTYPDNLTAFVKADVDGSYILTVGGVDYHVNVLNHTANITLNRLNAGKYNVTLRFSDTQNYTNSQNTTLFEIFKVKNQLKVTVGDVEYGENATIYITSSEKGNYTLTINGRDCAIINVNGTANYTLTNLAGGDYIVNITYCDIINYENPMNSTSFSVSKIPNALSISIDNVTYPDKIIAFVKASVNGQYFIIINNKKYSVEVLNNTANITLQVPAGLYVAEIIYHDSENYTNPSNTTLFSVNKGSVLFNVSVGDVAYNDDVIVKINSNTDGFYIVSVVGTSYLQNAEVKNGTGNVTFNTLPFGEYEVYVMFLSNNNYDIVDNSTKFNVVRANVTMNLTYEDNFHGKDLIINAKSPSNGNYTVIINNEEYKLTILNGGGSVLIPALAIGNYTVKVKCDQSQYYNPFEQSFNVTVQKAIDYDFGIITPLAIYGGNAIVSITLPGDATGKISINGIYNATIDGNCIIEIPNLSIGNHSITIEYSGDYNYTGVSKNAVITVISSIDANDTVRVYNTEYDFKVSLLTSDNGPLSNKRVVLTIDKVNITVATDEQGMIVLSQLPIGNHTIVVHNPDTNESVKYTVNIISRFSNYNNIVMSYYSGTKYRVYVFDDDGNVASGVKVQFIINGVSRLIKTTSQGYASITIKELPGAYTIIATYKGQSVSSTIVVKQTLKPYKKTVTVKKSAKKLVIKATLKRYTGKAISGKKITFKFKGKKYTAKTNSKGIAKITVKKSVIKKLKAGKKYLVTFTYVKNTVNGYVKVKK